MIIEITICATSILLKCGPFYNNPCFIVQKSWAHCTTTAHKCENQSWTLAEVRTCWITNPRAETGRPWSSAPWQHYARSGCCNISLSLPGSSHIWCDWSSLVSKQPVAIWQDAMNHCTWRCYTTCAGPNELTNGRVKIKTLQWSKRRCWQAHFS